MTKNTIYEVLKYYVKKPYKNHAIDQNSIRNI